MPRSLRLAPIALVALFVACGDMASPPVDAPNFAQSQAIADQFIVVLQDNAPPGLERQLGAAQGGVLYTYETALRGFAFKGSQEAADALARNRFVAYVEQDRVATLHATQNNPPTWGIDRIDQRTLPLDQSYTYDNLGSGVNIYILDTGIRLTHNDFGVRANYIPNGSGGDFVNDGHGNAADCHGHGTHVAGTAAGSSYGVAKGATIWSGRVVNCQGSGNVSMAIAGVDWITANGQQPASVNMSLGYGNVQSLRDAVEASVGTGFNYAVSAGNGNFVGIPQDACAGSPAGAPNANTVGATASNDSEASFSNFGTCIDILGPGVSIVSAWYTSNTAAASLSGTSMSSPHVAGAIALYLHANTDATPAQVSNALTSNASQGEINLHRRSRRGGTPNLLLYTAFIGGAGQQNQAPSASFTFGCTELACGFDGSGSSDSDGSIASYAWNFGDGNNGAGVSPSHTFGSGGTYSVTLLVTDNVGATGATSQNVTVGVPTPGISVTSITPSTMQAGSSINVTITGSGFAPGASVTFENGSGPAPTTSNIVVGNGTITATISSKGGGPRGSRVWDVRVTNSDNSTGVLVDGFTVTR